MISNNNYDFTKEALKLAKNNINNVVGFITQKRIECEDLLSLTPGISNQNKNIEDQKYRNIKDVDSDIFIVGRALYNSSNVECLVNSYL